MTDWPVRLRGVTESVVTTLGPNDRYNVAALGIHAPDDGRDSGDGRDSDDERDSGDGRGTDDGRDSGDGRDSDDERDSGDGRGTDDGRGTGDNRTENAGGDSSDDDRTENAGGDSSDTDSAYARARTWGRTRTWRNFTERGEGYVQFVRNPVVFVDATLGIRELDGPVLPDADAWVRVTVERIDAGRDGGTEWVDWRLVPVERDVRRRVVPAFDRGYAAVVEATVAASRLDVDAYDTETLRERIAYFERVGDRCGGPEVQAAFERFHELVDLDGRD